MAQLVVLNYGIVQADRHNERTIGVLIKLSEANLARLQLFHE